MAKYRIMVSNIEYGFVDVVADSLEEAEAKAECLDGDYFVNNNETTSQGLLEMLED